ncbi:MAG: UDP-N-acetylglucosamine 1-carboxyvinyltransferase [Abditibacteriota bacterium]|nr:UDP-N-acetylglucosamine 1-carboxyvinyltransferase [Abditibacteriota bacterium]
MSRLVIEGGVPLSGDVFISGSKNATLAIMAGSVGIKGVTVLHNVPVIADVIRMANILETLGIKCDFDKVNHTMTIDARRVTSFAPPAYLVSGMRAGFYIMGSLLARTGNANIPHPGGCNIGIRGINFHVDAFNKMGAIVNEVRKKDEFDSTEQYVFATCKDTKLHGADITMDFSSAGASEHIIAAACLAEGKTTIFPAALEPEVLELAKFMNAAGGHVEYDFDKRLATVYGTEELHGPEYTIPGDRMEIGTYAVAAAITGGKVTIHNVVPEDQAAVVGKLTKTGAVVKFSGDTMMVSMNKRPKAVDIETAVHPGFPTDMQQPFSAYMAIADGHCSVDETIYEARFEFATSLNKMGAKITRTEKGKHCDIDCVEKLHGCKDMYAPDLRGGAAIVCAALAAVGKSTITNIEVIERGYENLVDKVRTLGAKIEKYED